jgi:hypothetical protein
MFVPVPPGPEEKPAPETAFEPQGEQYEAAPETASELDGEPYEAPRGRHRVTWPALVRLSSLFRFLAVLSLVGGVIMALVALFLALQMGQAVWLLYALCAALSGFIWLIVWRGLAEGILLLIAIERNTRQTRDRLPKNSRGVP